MEVSTEQILQLPESKIVMEQNQTLCSVFMSEPGVEQVPSSGTKSWDGSGTAAVYDASAQIFHNECNRLELKQAK